MLRRALVLWHRFVGLAIAGFLVMSGVTGAIISWDHELDEWLNAHLTRTATQGPHLQPLHLAERLADEDPRIFVTYVPLHVEEGHSLVYGAEPRFDPQSGEVFPIGFNEIFVDPVSGETIGKREWGAVWPITRENFVSFLYVLHYSLHIPEFWGIDLWGIWLMGTIAVLWSIDCFVGFYLTLPVARRQSAARPPAVSARLAQGWWSRWKPAWKIKWRGSAYRINFDLHRAFSLWTWIILFLLALSAASLNFYTELAQPIVNLFSSFTPTPYDTREALPDDKLLDPQVTYAEVLANGEAEAKLHGFTAPPGDIFYSPDYGVFGVRFFEPGDDHGAAGVGPPTLYFDSEDGRYLGDYIPWRGTAGDLFLQLQFPLHSGRIAGLVGRIVVSVMGIVVAMLSVTGVVIWHRKRRARLSVRTSARSGERAMANAAAGDAESPGLAAKG